MIDKYILALISIVGCCLDVLGALYLAYDLLGGEHGPLPLVGARKLSQLQDNLGSFDLELSAEHLKPLDEASRVGLGFPYELYTEDMLIALAYGGMR